MTVSKLNHFQDWNNSRRRPKSVVIQMLDSLIELVEIGKKIGLSDRECMDLINTGMLPSPPIFGPEAGEKLKGSIKKINTN